MFTYVSKSKSIDLVFILRFVLSEWTVPINNDDNKNYCHGPPTLLNLAWKCMTRMLLAKYIL